LEEAALGTSNTNESVSASVSVVGCCAMKGAASTMLSAAVEAEGCWMVGSGNDGVGRTDATVKASVSSRPTAKRTGGRRRGL
jgi:hypothetical protein